MAGSLFDQLKKSGLVDDKKVKKIQQEKRQQVKQSKANKAKKGTQVEQSEAAILAAKAAEQKLQRDRELNQQRQKEQEHKAKRAELKQIIETNLITDFSGEIAYNFSDDGRVKTLYVNESTQKALTKEKILIVRFKNKNGDYALIKSELAEKITQRDSSMIVKNESLNSKLSQEDADYYAKFEVPDDLIW